jgi:hypothetical protein
MLLHSKLMRRCGMTFADLSSSIYLDTNLRTSQGGWDEPTTGSTLTLYTVIILTLQKQAHIYIAYVFLSSL